jgi:hypothetical protein
MDVENLPATLRELVIPTRETCFRQRIYTHKLVLPEQLRVLKVSNVVCITNSDQPITLPKHLEVLHCGMLQRPLAQLPDSLKVLKIGSLTSFKRLGTLPPALEELDVSRMLVFQRSLGTLPQTSKKIKLHKFYMRRLSRLPKKAVVNRVSLQLDEDFHCY